MKFGKIKNILRIKPTPGDFKKDIIFCVENQSEIQHMRTFLTNRIKLFLSLRRQK